MTAVLHWAPQAGTETGTGKAIASWVAAAASEEVRVKVLSFHQPDSSVPENLSYLGHGMDAAALRQVFRDELATVDVVHLHGAFDPSLSRVLRLAVREKHARRRSGRGLSIVLTPHGALSDYVFAKGRLKKALYWRLVDRRLVKSADRVICNTPVEREQFLRRMPGVRCDVIPLVVAPGNADVALAENGKHENEPPTLVTIGRYDVGIKGLDLLIDAVVGLRQRGRNVKLRCIGYDAQGGIDALRQVVERLGASEWVDCAGPKFGTEKLALLNAAAIFCMPSRYESFSYSLMEGLASGRPVLVGAGACVTSYFEARLANDLVVEPGVVDWMDAIERVLDDPEPNRRSAKEAYDALKRKCSEAEVGASLGEIYRGLVRGTF
jgi:glycosyltransferase involved in cell wall biosynthesis